MRRLILAVGRCRDKPVQALMDLYAGRCDPPLELIEVEEKRPLGGDELKRREGDLLLAAAGEGCDVIALDPRGRMLSSEAFAAELVRRRDHGVRRLGFVLGGAEGLDGAVLARAGLVLSFGAMIFPHMLARIMLAEQIFRADMIRLGHPYHRG